jgi:hypothetical protein
VRREDTELGRLCPQLLDADVAGSVHPLLVRQECVVELDEAVPGGEDEDTDGTGDPLGGSSAHEVIRADVEAAGGVGRSTAGLAAEQGLKTVPSGASRFGLLPGRSRPRSRPGPPRAPPW